MHTDAAIIITSEGHVKDEASLWVEFLKLGIGKIHVRKPNFSTGELLMLINKVPVEYRKRLVIHHNTDVVDSGVGGIHLPYHYLNQHKVDTALTLSGSAHSWSEVRTLIKVCNYCFISPVFNSISKIDYPADEALQSVPPDLKGQKIYALGGIDAKNVQSALKNGYYGVAALGFIWHENDASSKAKQLLEAVATSKNNGYEKN